MSDVKIRNDLTGLAWPSPGPALLQLDLVGYIL